MQPGRIDQPALTCEPVGLREGVFEWSAHHRLPSELLGTRERAPSLVDPRPIDSLRKELPMRTIHARSPSLARLSLPSFDIVFSQNRFS